MNKKILFISAFLAAFLLALLLVLSNSTQPKKNSQSIAAPTTNVGIASTSPADGAENIPPSTTLSIFFSDSVNASQITLSSSPEANFALKSQSDNTVVFEPTDNLQPNTTYTITISSPVKFSWSFTTRNGTAGEDINYIRAAEKDTSSSVYQKLVKITYMIQKLPFSTSTFTLSYDPKSNMFTVATSSATGKNDALSWIKSQQVVPSTINLQYK